MEFLLEFSNIFSYVADDFTNGKLGKTIFFCQLSVITASKLLLDFCITRLLYHSFWLLDVYGTASITINEFQIRF